MTDEEAKTFRLLTEAEFNALSTEERIEYLKKAMEARNAINRLIDRSLEPGSAVAAERRRASG